MSFVALLSRIRQFYIHYKTCSGKYPFSSMIFFMISGNLSATLGCQNLLLLLSWFTQNSEIIKLSLLVLNSAALALSPPFCFTLSHNGVAFSQIIFESVGMHFSQQSCTYINAAFSTWDKKLFHKKCKLFVPPGIGGAQLHEFPFPFF